MKNIIATLALMASFSVNASGWVYKAHTDRMTDIISRFAEISSVNSGNPGPSNGREVSVTLRVAKSSTGLATYGTFSVVNGRFDCRPPYGCEVKIRFDNEKHMVIQTSLLSTSLLSTSELVFFDSAFEESASKAKRILVEVKLYAEGVRVFEFQTVRPLERGLIEPRTK